MTKLIATVKISIKHSIMQLASMFTRLQELSLKIVIVITLPGKYVLAGEKD